jgi:hypothetical protein
LCANVNAKTRETNDSMHQSQNQRLVKRRENTSRAVLVHHKSSIVV